MDKDQQSLNARKKSQKKTKYEDVLETLGHSFKCNYGCHTRCYKNFTAVPVSQSTKPSTSTVSTRSKVLLNRAAQKANPPSQIFYQIFAYFVQKVVRNLKETIDIGKCETFDAEVTIRNAAKYLKDETLLSKIGSCEFGNGPDFATMETKYHHVCKREYTNNERRKKLRKVKPVFREKSNVCCIK